MGRQPTSHSPDGTLVTRMETEDTLQTFTMLQISSEDPSSTTSTFPKLVVDATLPFTSSKCQATTPTDHQTHLRVVTTTAMPTTSVVCGAQKWTSWKPTSSPGTQHLTSVMLHKASTSTTATEVVVENPSLMSIETAWVQEDSTESTPRVTSMPRLASTNLATDFHPLIWNSPKDPTP